MKKIVRYIPFFFFLAYIILISFIKSPLTGDAIVFANLKGNLFSILLSRYHAWTSRILIEGILIVMVKYAPWIWNIGNVLVWLLLYYSFRKIVNRKNDFYIDCIISLLIILYSYMDMSSAGWSATTVNYLWPLSLGLFAVVPILSIIKDEKVSLLQILLSIPCLLFSVNQEQCACLLTGYMLLFLIYYYIKEKKISPIISIFLVISIIGVIFSLTAPGNYNRYQQEMARWFMDYDQLNFGDKIILSIQNTFEMFLSRINYICIAFYGCICYFLYLKKSRKWMLICGFFLLLGTIILPFTSLFSFNELYNSNFVESQAVLPYLKIGSVSYYLSFSICIIYIIFTCVLLLSFSNKDIYRKWLLCIVFISAILSRMIIGFSPTIFASSFRTGIFMDYLIIILILLVYNVFNCKVKEKRKIVYFFLFLFILKFSITFYHYVSIILFK